MTAMRIGIGSIFQESNQFAATQTDLALFRNSYVHEGDALLVGEAELLQERVEERPFVAAGAACLDQVPGPRHHPLALSHGQVDVGEQGADGPGFVQVGRGANRLAKGAEPASLRIDAGHDDTPRGYPGPDAALRPAVRPNTAPDVSPVPPG